MGGTLTEGAPQVLLQARLLPRPLRGSLHNILYATLGCNSLQWFCILSCHTHAKQCNPCMSDQAYQSDARADMKILEASSSLVICSSFRNSRSLASRSITALPAFADCLAQLVEENPDSRTPSRTSSRSNGNQEIYPCSVQQIPKCSSEFEHNLTMPAT
ncbi:uncharacterized protein LOC133851559 isoform X4 [Alnus glutinosa]|uniref:uncharacterized protein LOC133851559 isoform X4 n=1 Tax=Alnus glutinosa TaxID=3517 RepID=UPI002D78F9F2|nr:uncharacterized protein LOC133851559 isoform X4 [Alnus glutinosa]